MTEKTSTRKTSTKPSTPQGTLKAHAKRIAHEADHHGHYPPEPPTPDELVAFTRVSTLIAVTMLQVTLSMRDIRILAGPRNVGMTVAVPDASWVTPVTRALSKTRPWADTYKRSGGSKVSDKPENGSDAAGEALSGGSSILGVSTDPVRYLPAALVSSADVRIVLDAPSLRVIRKVIRLVTGQRRVGRMGSNIVQGLSADEIAACIRRDDTARSCVRRLEAASRSKRAPVADLADVPLLKDCHGYGEAGAWGLRLVSAIEDVRAGKREWSSVEDKNIVLSGEAGVGKTTFARSLAKSLQMPLLATSVSSWFSQTNGYLNDICRKIDEVFQQAASQGAVLLLDECDSIPNRATCDPRHREYWVSLVSHLLMTLDGAVSGAASKIIVIGATNFPERLDEALVRPGRLNRVVHIERPDDKALAGILRQHLKDDLSGEDLGPLAAIGSGATGAQAAGWVRGARMAAAAASRRMVADDLLSEIAPPETRSPESILATARHEAAHCVSVEGLSVGTIHSVSIVAQGPFAGKTLSRLRDATSIGAAELDALVVSTLCGRAADEHWGKPTSGAAGGPASDLAAATELVAGKHGSYGLGTSLVYRGDRRHALALLDDPAFLRIVHSDLDALYARAREFVRTHEAAIDAVAARLVVRRVLGGDAVRSIIAAHPPARTLGSPDRPGGIHA